MAQAAWGGKPVFPHPAKTHLMIKV